MKMLFQVEAMPIDPTTLSYSLASRKKQRYTVLVSRSLPAFAQGKQTPFSWLQEGDWKTQHSEHENVHILRASREVLAVRIWTNLLTLLSLSSSFLKWDSNRYYAACCTHNIHSRVILYLH